ncbi:neuronal acetylcholine receptor subunit alpha-3-like [Ornithodoros turicata]|uniref:neuronal acetylcholine receptor subunit alpha-3-like n=1 Tax=Ornithodoros turicata TaxID=34597 RepID=UPI0031398524
MDLQSCFVMLLVTCLVKTVSAENELRQHTRRLRSVLFNKTTYDPRMPPIRSFEDTVPMDVKFHMVRAPTLDTNNHLFQADAILCTSWEDVHMEWDPSQYGGVQRLTVGRKEVWTPELMNINGRSISAIGTEPARVWVSFDGRMQFCRPSPVQSVCVVDLSNFPFDKHECAVHYSMLQSFAINVGNITVSSRPFEGEFRVLRADGGKEKLEANTGYLYETLTLRFVLERRNQLHRYTLVVPSIATFMLILLVVCLPPGSDRKITVASVALLIILMVLHGTSYVATRSVKVPKLVTALGALSMVDGIVLVLTMLSMNMTKFPTTSTLRPPSFIVKLSEGFLGKVLCLCDPALSEKEARGETTGYNARKEWYIAAQALDRLLFLVLLIAFVIILC